MEDRKLMEMAARAAGLDLATWDEGRGCMYHPFRSDLQDGHCWNPLADDGDALRLAIKRGISVWRDDDLMRVGAFSEVLTPGADHAAIARRLIVRAAAIPAEPGKASIELDAARFRWLQEHTVATGLSRWMGRTQTLDVAVDAAMAAEKAASAA